MESTVEGISNSRVVLACRMNLLKVPSEAETRSMRRSLPRSPLLAPPGFRCYPTGSRRLHLSTLLSHWLRSFPSDVASISGPISRVFYRKRRRCDSRNKLFPTSAIHIVTSPRPNSIRNDANRRAEELTSNENDPTPSRHMWWRSRSALCDIPNDRGS